MQGMFPYFRIAPQTALLALVSATVLGVLAAAIPSYNVSKLRVVDALRRVHAPIGLDIGARTQAGLEAGSHGAAGGALGAGARSTHPVCG